jgi:hypothetical protein|tara:strand:+ start:773 stop:1156 length:384 start_codon:yes stop_codon:yes gene_type:complete
MNEKYLYFRTQATIGDDDGTGESCCFPLSALVGMQPTADSSLTLYFKSMLNRDGMDVGSNAVVVSDSVTLTLATANTHKEAMQDLCERFLSSKDGMIVVGDDLSTNTEYFSTLISAVGTITVAAANS